MEISYGKKNIIILFVCLLLGTATIFGVNHLYLQPLEAKHSQAQLELQQAQTVRNNLITQKQQLEIIEGNSVNVEELPQLIPFGGLQPESLLVTLAEAADQTGVTLTNHNFGTSTPMTAKAEGEGEEISQGPTLMKTTLTLTLEGDNTAQFQEFIQLLEQTPRLIQVESFSVDQQSQQVPAMAIVEPMSSTASEEEENNYSLKGQESIKGVGPENEANEEGTAEEETEANEHAYEDETTEDKTIPPVVEISNMRANVTIVIFFFEN